MAAQSDRGAGDLDALLERFYAADDPQAERLLGELVQQLLPRVRGLLARRGVPRDDLDDLCGITSLRLVAALRRARAPGEARIVDCLAYALAIAGRAPLDSVQRGRVTYRYRQHLLEVLELRASAPVFARWQAGGRWVAGLAAWRGARAGSNARWQSLEADASGFCRGALGGRDPARLPLPELLAHLFRWVGEPLPVEELAGILLRLQRVEDTAVVSIDALLAGGDADATALLPPAPDDVAAQVITALTGEESRARLWEEARCLRPRQRKALLLGLEYDELLLLAGTAGAISAELEIELAELLALRPRLPLPDRAIAQWLGATEQQVSNLRKCARERLARRQGRWQSDDAPQ